MNRKYNPYVSLVALILVLTCTGCHVDAEAAETKPAHRYTYEVEDHFGGPRFYTITDTWTGNQYLFVRYGEGAGLTKLEE